MKPSADAMVTSVDVSVVTTLYYSAPYVDEFYRRASAAAARLTSRYEIVFVVDGSPDDALERAVAIHRSDPRVMVVDLSRRFGHHKAMMTGLAHARGDLVFLIDSDLDESPEWLATFRSRMSEDGVDVVYGVQAQRTGDWLDRLGGRLFYAAFNMLSADPLPANLMTVRLMTRRYVDALLRFREREFAIAGLWAITGFRQVGMPVNKSRRQTTTYTLQRRVTVLVDAVTAFSSRPLIAIFYLGAAILIAASVAAAYLICRRLFFGVLLSGWPSLIVSVWMLGGLMTFCVGVVGIYVAKIFSEVKQRPYTIVREVFQSAPNADEVLGQGPGRNQQPMSRS